VFGEKPTGQVPFRIDDVFVLDPDRRAVDDHGPDALGVGDQTVGPGREVADAAERRAADGLGIEDDHVGRQPFGESTASLDPEALGRRRSELAHRLFEREGAPLAHPVPEQVGGGAGVAELARVSAGVGQAQDRGRVLEELGDGRFVGVGDRHAEASLEVGGERQIEGQLRGVLAALLGHVRHAALGQLGSAGTFADHHVAPTRGQRAVLAALPEGLAELGTRVDALATLEVRLGHGLEDREALEGEGCLELELDDERPARDLGHHVDPLGLELARLLEHALVSVGTEHAREQCGPAHRASGLALDVGQLVQEEAAADGRLHDAAIRFAECAGQALDLGQ
jgi:hypothetical protein